MMNEAEQQKEKEKQAQSNTLQNPLLFNDDDDDFSSDRHINIIIQEKNKKEVKVLIHNVSINFYSNIIIIIFIIYNYYL